MPVWIAFLVAGVSRIFATRLGSWLVSAMLFLGLSWGTTAVSMVGIKALVASKIAGLSGPALDWAVFFNIPQYLSIVISAYGAAAAVGGAKRVFLMRHASGGAPS
jgi:hypothetical protein